MQTFDNFFDKHDISFESTAHNIYEPCFSSGNVTPRVKQKEEYNFHIDDYIHQKNNELKIPSKNIQKIQKQLFGKCIKIRDKLF